jgi:hypothetical protein
MFRRIEFTLPGGVDDEGLSYPPSRSGLMTPTPEPVADAWIDDLIGPGRSLPANCRFYFTEKGWREVGRSVIAAAQQTHQEYRLIAIKETDAQVVWRDKARGYEVAVQPKRARPLTHRRRSAGE